MSEEPEDYIDAEELIHSALSAALVSVLPEGTLLSRWVLVFETIGEEGKGVSLVRSPGTENWEALGMASAATELLKGTIGFLPVDDDEEDE